jgi:hypothetical protein
VGRNDPHGNQAAAAAAVLEAHLEHQLVVSVRQALSILVPTVPAKRMVPGQKVDKSILMDHLPPQITNTHRHIFGVFQEFIANRQQAPRPGSKMPASFNGILISPCARAD